VDIVGERRACLKDSANDRLAAFVARVGFAGVDELYRARLASDLFEPIDLGKKQIRALVSGGTPGKPKCKNFLVQLNSSEPTNLL
jgi:hypothetical protein